MTDEVYRLGIDAIVSFQCKFIHPHPLRDAKFPNPDVGQRLSNARVVRRALKKIKQKPTLCVVVHHKNFKDGDGTYHDIWCSESHVRVEKEGDPDLFFQDYHTDREVETNVYDNGYKSSAIENAEQDSEEDDGGYLDKDIIKDDSTEKKAEEPLATVREVFSFAKSWKTKMNLAIGLFASALSGLIQPGETFHLSFHGWR